MQRFIVQNWLILAIASLLVALYIWLFEGFIQGKSYMFVILSVVFGGIYWRNRKRGGK